LVGDFNHDGKADFALIGGVDENSQNWTAIPIAFSQGTLDFSVVRVSPSDAGFMEWVNASGVTRHAARVLHPTLSLPPPPP
jgi:hypothetical protein